MSCKPSVTPRDNIFELMQQFRDDLCPDKIDLAPGVYRNEQGQPAVLDCVRKALPRVLDHPDFEYLPSSGLPSFVSQIQDFIIGKYRVASVQTLSGTGSNHLAALWLAKHANLNRIYISDPSWFNHVGVFTHAGLKPFDYPYFDAKTLGFAFENFMHVAKTLPDGSAFCLHACGHNPTGIDPSPQQWQQIARLFLEKRHVALFDASYLGFVSGSIQQDKHAIDLFLAKGIKTLVALGLGKSTGLYAERIGSLHITCSSEQEQSETLAQLNLFIRHESSGSPAFGARILSLLLGDPQLRLQWEQDVQMMAARVARSRQLLHDALIVRSTPGCWQHILDQKGMFSYTGLSGSQCSRLLLDKHLYLPHTGRISMCGVTPDNVDRIADCIAAVVRYT